MPQNTSRHQKMDIRIIAFFLVCTFGICACANIGRMNVQDFENPQDFNCTASNDIEEDSSNNALTVFYLRFEESMTSFTLRFYGSNYSCIGNNNKNFPCNLHGINSSTGENEDFQPTDYTNYSCKRMTTVLSAALARKKNAETDECVQQSKKGNLPHKDQQGKVCSAKNKVHTYDGHGNFGCYPCCQGSWFDYDETKLCLKCSSKFTTPGSGVYPSCSVEVVPSSPVSTSATPVTQITTSTSIPTLMSLTTTTTTSTTRSLTRTTANSVIYSTVNTSVMPSTSMDETTSVEMTTDKNNTGAIVGVVLGVLALIIGLVILYCKRKRIRECFRRNAPRNEDQQNGDNPERDVMIELE